MLKINRKVEYALMALKFMSEKSEENLTSAREVCDQFSTPFDTTAKVMQSMNQYGILKSVKGTKGGYFLSKSLSQITYMDLTRIVEKKDNSNVCMGNKGLCELYSSCNIVDPIEKLNRTLNEYLEKLTIAELFETSFGKQTYPQSDQLKVISNE